MPKRVAKKKLKVKIKQKQKQKQTQIVNVNITGKPRRAPTKKASGASTVEQPIQQIFRVNEPNYPIYRYQEPVQQPSIRIQEPVREPIRIQEPVLFEAPNVPIPVPVIIEEEEEPFREVEEFKYKFDKNTGMKRVFNQATRRWVNADGAVAKRLLKKHE